MRALSLLIIFALGSLGIQYYWQNTQEVARSGGEYVEAMVGQTRFINPILSQTNDVDADLSALIFSSLLKTGPDGALKSDLAEGYEISEDKLTYTFHLRQNAYWHDGEKVTADDVVYTIKTIQDESYYSPLIANWKGIRAEKVDDYTVRFILKNAYSPFLNNLTFGVLPRHKWEAISANEFPLSELNFKPVGSGPYQFDSYKKDTSGKIISITLEANEDYYDHAPFIRKVTLKFFSTEDEALTAFNRKEVRGVNYLSPANKARINDLEARNLYRLEIPRYYAVFFNQTQSKALADKTVRLALSYAADKNKLVNDVLKGEGKTVESPIPQGLLGYTPETKIYNLDAEYAKTLLEQGGWTDADGDGVREKGADKLEFTLTTTSLADAQQTAEELASMWKNIGANVKVATSDNIQADVIKPRQYEALLFGEILSYDPDPYAFWHSSEKKDPGLNLALYDNADVDKILSEARQETDPNVRAQKYQQFQQLLIEDVPAIFLYSPNYLYLQSQSVKGLEAQVIITPADRFNDISNWYLKTRRVAK